ncbi:MAG: hypothetical protein WC390_06590 [Sulfurimonas sp.]|jgi:hypothetical protein
MAYTQELATAANWIWEHKDEPQFWNWPVLTRHNDAEDSLNFPDTVAWNVFTILEKRGLIDPFMAEKDGKTFPAFKLNLNNEIEWEKTKKPPTKWDTEFWEPLARTGVNIWTFIVWILSLVIASGMTYGVERLIDWRWPAP